MSAVRCQCGEEITVAQAAAVMQKIATAKRWDGITAEQKSAHMSRVRRAGIAAKRGPASMRDGGRKRKVKITA